MIKKLRYDKNLRLHRQQVYETIEDRVLGDGRARSDYLVGEDVEKASYGKVWWRFEGKSGECAFVDNLELR